MLEHNRPVEVCCHPYRDIKLALSHCWGNPEAVIKLDESVVASRIQDHHLVWQREIPKSIRLGVVDLVVDQRQNFRVLANCVLQQLYRMRKYPELKSRALESTWFNLFDPDNEDAWLDLDGLTAQYASQLFRRLADMLSTDYPFDIRKLDTFFFKCNVQYEKMGFSESELFVVKKNKDELYIPAMATVPYSRELGLGTFLIQYLILLLYFFKIGKVLTLDTNAQDSQVSGGKSPYLFWKKVGFEVTQIGHYDDCSGEKIVFRAKISALAEDILVKNPMWRKWWENLQQLNPLEYSYWG